MTKRVSSCPHCGSDMPPGVSICKDCRKTLTVAIRNIGRYWLDLANVHLKQTHYGTGGGTRGRGELPIPIDLRFAPKASGAVGYGAMVENDVKDTLRRWVTVVLEQRPGRDPNGYPTVLGYSPRIVDSVAGCCAFLLANIAWLASSVHAPRMLDDVLGCETKLRTLVDRPADRWYAGVCGATTTAVHDGLSCGCACHNGPGHDCDQLGGCGTTWKAPTCRQELRPRKPEGWLKCSGCGALHDIGRRREELLEDAMSHNLRAADLARALVGLQVWDGASDRLAARIRLWASTRRLTPMAHDVRPKLDGGGVTKVPLYRLEHVVDLIAEDARHAEEKQARRRGRRGA